MAVKCQAQKWPLETNEKYTFREILLFQVLLKNILLAQKTTASQTHFGFTNPGSELN